MQPAAGTSDAEIKVSSSENPELSKVLFLKSGAGQTIAACFAYFHGFCLSNLYLLHWKKKKKQGMFHS